MLIAEQEEQQGVGLDDVRVSVGAVSIMGVKEKVGGEG